MEKVMNKVEVILICAVTSNGFSTYLFGNQVICLLYCLWLH